MTAKADDTGQPDDITGDDHALSEVLDRVEAAAEGTDEVSLDDLIEAMGRSSIASLMLAFSLISTSPASAIPGITAFVAVIVFILNIQLMIRRDSVWLPSFITRRRVSAEKLRGGVKWLRRPVEFVERFLRPRLTFLFHRPWLWLPMILILGLTAVMPLMEVIPTSGSIGSAVIALFAASLLTRDGLLAVLSFALLCAVPVLAWVFLR